MCPYYFVLEERFSSHAGTRATATSDCLFEGIASDKEDSKDELYCYNGVFEFDDEQDDENLSADSNDNHYVQKKLPSSKNQRTIVGRQEYQPKNKKGQNTPKQMDSMLC